ncbi:MAG: hypothetical protein V7606_2568, partial [Burkholderiales bacterium]
MYCLVIYCTYIPNAWWKIYFVDT